MAAEVVVAASGTKLQYGTPYASPVYADVGQVVSLDGPSSEVSTRDTSHLLTTHRTFDVGIYDGGEVSGEVEYDPAGDTHTLLRALQRSPAIKKWKMIYTDSGAGDDTFDGILTKWNPTGIAIGENLMAEFSIKVSGNITFTP